MSDEANALIPRTGPAPRVHTSVTSGQQSLYRQRVLDEETYTESLSKIITRDFFPDLAHVQATNDYLLALSNNDPDLLSSSIRKLAAISQNKDEPAGGVNQTYNFANTPQISVPGRSYANVDYAHTPRDHRPVKKRKPNRVRDDLPLDAFQANYTSEDNASFVQIVDNENKQRQTERWGWAWEAEARANQRKLEGEQRRKAVLDAATSGRWKVDGHGRRLIGGLEEGSSKYEEAEAWATERMINGSGESSALVLRGDRNEDLKLLPTDPLRCALDDAGLPTTATVMQSGSSESSCIHYDADDKQEVLPLGGSGLDGWGYQAMNGLMFPADANTKPYARPQSNLSSAGVISHANTRLPDEGAEGQAVRRSSSPSRSWVNAAVNDRRTEHPLLPPNAEPSPTELPSLMTWGSLLATPRALGDDGDPLDRRSFRLPEEKRRDEIGRRLGVKASQSINERAKGFTPASRRRHSSFLSVIDRSSSSKPVKKAPGNMGPPSATPRRQESLTPAAKRLLARSIGR